MKRRVSVFTVLIVALLLLSVLWSTFPIVYLIIVSFAGLGALPTSLALPDRFTIQNWLNIFVESPIWPYLMNSLVVALIAITITLVVSLPAGYSFSRQKTRLSQALFRMFLVFRMLPFIAIVIPVFFMMQDYGLLGTRLGLSLAHLIYTVPIAVWLLKGFFDMVEPDMEDSARVDGASHLQAFVYITLPLARAGIAVSALFAFLYSYIEFPFAVILTKSGTSTLPVHLSRYYTIHETYWRELAAASLFSLLPMVIVFLLLRKNLVRGFTLGALK